MFRKTLTLFLSMSYIVTVPSIASRAGYDKSVVESQSKQIHEMAVAGNVGGLIEMLENGLFPSKVLAAEHLGEIGDQSALSALESLNEEHGGWNIRSTAHEDSGAFAVAICRILSRNKPEKEQIEALFDLLEGRGPAVPKSAEFTTFTVNGQVHKKDNYMLRRNYDVGKRVAAQLDKFNDPTIVTRLRQSVNNGAAIPAVWMEVRDMSVKDAISHCVEIATDEGDAQRYGAIHCLDKYGADAIDALDQLAQEGHREAIRVLGYQKENSKAFDLLCWHLLNNNNSQVRSASVSPVAYVQSENYRLKSLETLISALYDPNKNIRSRASSSLANRAYSPNKSYFDQIEESLLVAALKHPDKGVRENLMKAVTRLGYEGSGEQVGEPPAIRTDLEDRGWSPLTAEQRLKAVTDPLEERAAKFLKMGPSEEAARLYGELLELKPEHEPYMRALEKANAYISAAKSASEYWYPHAPYIGLKGRYSYYLTGIPEDTSELKEKYELAREQLATLHYPNWSGIFSKDPKATDQYVKAKRLYEHIIEHYPENEYLVLCSKEDTGGLNYNLYRDSKKFILAYIDLFAVDLRDIIDSTNQQRNIPLPNADGMTQAQVDFQKYYKNDESRNRLIEKCISFVNDLKLLRCTQHRHVFERPTPDPEDDFNPFDEIIRRCAETDPELVKMVKEAKAETGESDKCLSDTCIL